MANTILTSKSALRASCFWSKTLILKLKWHKVTLILFFWSSLLILPDSAWCDARIAKFRSSETPSQYIAIGGNYSSDYNSKKYKISAGYNYKSDQFINEIDFMNQVDYVENSSQKVLVKNEELYDGEISSKVLIGRSNNYFNYYNRSKYDAFSDYYYDITNSIGWGRIMFDGLLEADINIGYNEIKNFDSQIVLNPNLKFSFDITDRIKFTTKAYIFQVQNSYYEELKSRISYRLTNHLFFELYHNYDKKRFFHQTSKIEETKTEISRDFVARIRYEF